MRYRERDDLVMLRTCCIGSSILSEISANVEDTVISQLKWIDIMVRVNGNKFRSYQSGRPSYLLLASTKMENFFYRRSMAKRTTFLLQEPF